MPKLEMKEGGRFWGCAYPPADMTRQIYVWSRSIDEVLTKRASSQL